MGKSDETTAAAGTEDEPELNSVTDGTVKTVALTFDDGPHPVMTPRVLDRLDAYGIKATFFWIGRLVTASARVAIDRIVKSGHEIGNHSWSWESMDGMTSREVEASIRMTNEAIRRFTGREPAFFRPPNLAVSPVMYEAIRLPFAEGILGLDWEACGTSAEERARNVLKDVRDGAIILLHDVQPEPHPTPEALDMLIPELLGMGYEFETLSGLFERKRVRPDSMAGKMWSFVGR